MTPEEKARIEIDKMLEQAGWIVQDRSELNIRASMGVAIREFVMKDNGESDYLLFVNGKAIGVLEAKKAELSLSGVENQSQSYACNLPEGARYYQMPLPFIYESNGSEIYFRDCRDVVCRSRRLFTFHKPETLFELISNEDTLRNKLTMMPELNKEGLRDCQVEAIVGLENSLKQGKPRALIQMATGAGKTFTTCNFTYRLLKHAKAKRILFLVDRNNLGEQTKKEYEQFKPKGENKAFTDIYIVQHLQQNKIDKDAKIVITTIQRLYSMLRGEEEYDETNEEGSAFEYYASLGKPKEVKYNPNLPIEYFDFIVVDECHRSIYGDWRQVLEYFDAFTIGLTATPSKQTLGYFNKNVVSVYTYERSVADKVNVGYEIYSIRTDVGENGGKIDKGFTVPVRDKKTRKQEWETLDDDLEYTKNDLDRTVLVPDHIRTILQCYKDTIFTELFPEREQTWIPKTLIFAKDDNHAEEIVRIAREVFNKGNDFCKKITYNVSGVKAKDLIAEFRTSPDFRIAVTVDMIATGTDIKPLEVVIFMRDVHSELYYEQMKGRGCRTLNNTDLQQVTPNAEVKNRFYLIDAVGVTESKKSSSQPFERKRTVSLKSLMEQVAVGKVDDDTLSSLAGRISAINANIDKEDNKKVIEMAGKTLSNIANDILNTIDYDKTESMTEDEIFDMKDEAVKPFFEPAFRRLVLELKDKSKLYIDELTPAKVISSEFSVKNAQELTTNFKEFIDANKNEIDALSIIYNKQYKDRHLTYEKIDELHDKLISEMPPLETANLWRAYKLLQKDKVKEVKNPAKLLTNIVQLVRFAIGQDEKLEDFSSVANSRFELWKGRQIKRGIQFTEEQQQWLEEIKNYIVANAYMELKDIHEAMQHKGGIIKARQVFGQELQPILDDLSVALVG